jgi:hypothetical protein
MTDAAGGRFARWSQRKAAARRGGALPVEREEAPDRVRPGADAQSSTSKRPEVAPAASEIAKSPDAAPAAGEDAPVLPPIEELTFESDFTAFMAKNVPEAVKRAALRKLWVSDPVLANLDGLNDYCEDHHLVDLPITLDQTSYKVGEGYLEEIKEELAKLDGAQSGHGGASEPVPELSQEARDDGNVSGTSLGDSDAVRNERPSAARRVVAVKIDEEASGPDDNTTK